MIVKKILILIVLIFLFLSLMAQREVSIGLQINDSVATTLYRDEPLIILVSISNPDAAYNEQWNRQADRWLKQLEELFKKGDLTKEKYNEEKKRIVEQKKDIQIPVIGSLTRPAYKIVQWHWKKEQGVVIENIPLKLLTDSSDVHELVVDGNAYYVLQWGLSRATMQTLKPGKYSLQCTIGNYHSDQVEIVIRTSAIPSSKISTEPMQQKLGKFALLSGEVETAAAHARNILKSNPASVSGLVLLGEVNIKKHNYKEALKSFEDALQNFNKKYPQSPEPPEYILGMIEWLKKNKN